MLSYVARSTWLCAEGGAQEKGKFTFQDRTNKFHSTLSQIVLAVKSLATALPLLAVPQI